MSKHINKLKANTKVGPIYNSSIVYEGTRTFPYFGYIGGGGVFDLGIWPWGWVTTPMTPPMTTPIGLILGIWAWDWVTTPVATPILSYLRWCLFYIIRRNVRKKNIYNNNIMSNRNELVRRLLSGITDSELQNLVNIRESQKSPVPAPISGLQFLHQEKCPTTDTG